MKTNDSSYYNPLNPIWDLPYDPKGGSGILKAHIWVEWDFGSHEYEKFLAYKYSETVNGIELEIEKPNIANAGAIEEDIMNSLRMENIKFDTISYINI